MRPTSQVSDVAKGGRSALRRAQLTGETNKDTRRDHTPSLEVHLGPDEPERKGCGDERDEEGNGVHGSIELQVSLLVSLACSP